MNNNSNNNSSNYYYNNNHNNNQYYDDNNEMMLPMDSTIATFESNRGHLCGQNNNNYFDPQSSSIPVDQYQYHLHQQQQQQQQYHHEEEERQEQQQQQQQYSPSVRFASSASRQREGGGDFNCDYNNNNNTMNDDTVALNSYKSSQPPFLQQHHQQHPSSSPHYGYNVQSHNNAQQQQQYSTQAHHQNTSLQYNNMMAKAPTPTTLLNYPSIKLINPTKYSNKLTNKLIAPIKTNVQMIIPGRLYMRMPIPTTATAITAKGEEEEKEEGLVYNLGDYSIGIKFTSIDSQLVDKARKKLERKDNKKKKDARGGSGGGEGDEKKSAHVSSSVERRDDDKNMDETAMRYSKMTIFEPPPSSSPSPHCQQQHQQHKEEEEVPKLASLHITHTSPTTVSTSQGPPPMTTSKTKTNTRTIWSTLPGQSFITSSSLKTLSITPPGSIVNENYSRIYDIQTIDYITPPPNNNGNGGSSIIIGGMLCHTLNEDGSLPSHSPRYTLQFILDDTNNTNDNDGGGGGGGLKFVLKVQGGENSQQHDYRVNTAHLFFAKSSYNSNNNNDDTYLGLGGRLSSRNLNGLEVQICHMTGVTNDSSNNSSGGSGSNKQYYSPYNSTSNLTIPHFLNPTTMVSTQLYNIEPTTFDFKTSQNWYCIKNLGCNTISGKLDIASTLLDLCTNYTTGGGGGRRSKLLPKWVNNNGIIVGLQGGTSVVTNVCKVLFKYKTNVAGVLIKDWTGSKVSTTTTSSLSSGGMSSPRSNSGSHKKASKSSSSNNNNVDTLISNAPQGKTIGTNPSYYNYTLERSLYPNYQPFIDTLERRGISVGLYVTPYVEEIPMHLRSGRRYLFDEIQGNWFVKKKISGGGGNKKLLGSSSPKLGKNNKGASSNNTNANNNHNQQQQQQVTMYNNFKHTKCGILDTTNYHASNWYKQSIVKEEMFDYANASFWLADMSVGGPPLDGVYTSSSSQGQGGQAVTTSSSQGQGQGSSSSSGSNALSMHNSYTTQFAKLNHDAIKEAGRDGDSFFIINGAYGNTARYANVTSLPDRVANFNSEDYPGSILQSVINGLVNGGLSGLTHSHCAVNMAVPRGSSTSSSGIDNKSREMICRWFELTAFTTIFRTHDGNNNGKCDSRSSTTGGSDGDNRNNMTSAYNDETVMKSLSKWSRVYVALSTYRQQLLNEASFKGWPVVRHPILHFPTDENFLGTRSSGSSSKGSGSGGKMKNMILKKKSEEDMSISSSFMLGDLVYVVPVVKSGVVKSRVYLPEGGWIHLWSGEQVAGPRSIGKTIEVDCPVGEPPVFIRDCNIMHDFFIKLKQNRVISSSSSSVSSKKRSDNNNDKSPMFSSFRRKK